MDAGHIELVLFLVSYFDAIYVDGKVHVRNKFFCVQHLKGGTGRGLFESVCKATQYMNITDWKTKMIGFGCDGASANMAEGGLRGLLRSEFPWICMFWCLAHRLELAVKDALKGTYFTTIDELL